MSITCHPDWPLIRPWIVIQRYGRDTGPNGARARIEFKRPHDGVLVRRFLALTMPCVACGRTIHPIRERGGQWNGQLYYAATCDSSITLSCRNGGKSRQEYMAVRRAIAEWQPEPPVLQGDLFPE